MQETLLKRKKKSYNVPADHMADIYQVKMKQT